MDAAKAGSRFHYAPAFLRYGAAVVFVLMALAARSAADAFLGERHPFPFFLAAVALAAWFGGRGVAFFATVLALAVAEFFFVEPRHAIVFQRAHDVVGALSFLFSSLVITLAIHLAHRRAGQLVEERERLRVTLGSIGDAVIATDTQGRVTFINPVACELTGWSFKEARGKLLPEVFRIVNEDTRQPVENPVSKVLRHGRVVGLANHTALIAKDGKERAIADSGAPIRDREGDVMGVVLVFRDVTAERAAKERDQRLARHGALRAEVANILTSPKMSIAQMLQLCTESIMRHLPAAFARIWTLNAAKQMLELQASAGMYTHLNGPHAQVPVGKFKIGLIAQEAQPHLTNDVLHDARISNPEWARKEGMVAFAGYPLLVDGNVLGVLALFAKEPLPEDTLDALSAVADLVAQGIQRRRAEESLQRSEEEFRAFFELASIGAGQADPATRRLITVNDRLCEITGYSREELLRIPLQELTHPDDRVADWEKFMRMLRGETREYDTEKRYVRKDGTVIWVHVSAVAIRDSQGKPVRTAAVVIDITERKEAEDALRQRERELRISEKALKGAQAKLQEYASSLEVKVAERTTQLRHTVAELEAFSYSLSHDMRAPLRAIQSFAQLVLADYGAKLDANGNDFLNKIIASAQRLDRLIQDVLAFTRLARQEITVQPVDVEALLDDIIRERPEFQPPHVELTISRPLLPVLGHDASLTQCITNLLDNAIKFVARGVKPRIHVYSELVEDKVRLNFQDNGIGIDKQGQARLFQMFNRLAGDQYQGTGIGLAIVRHAVERMGGRVGVESEAGQGSRFWIELTSAPADTHQQAKTPTPQHAMV